MADTHDPDEENLGLVAVADAPADEVRMQLSSECRFDDRIDDLESAGMGSMLKCVQHSGFVSVRKVEFSRSIGRKVVCNHFGNFCAEWLAGDYTLWSVMLPKTQESVLTRLPLEANLSISFIGHL